MSKSLKKKNFHFTPKVIVRLILFFSIIAILISYISTNTTSNNPNILGDQTTAPSDMPIIKLFVDNLYNQLPENSRSLIENANNLPLIQYTQKNIDYFKNEKAGFPQKQIKDLKLYILNKGQELLKGAADKTK